MLISKKKIKMKDYILESWKLLGTMHFISILKKAFFITEGEK